MQGISPVPVSALHHFSFRFCYYPFFFERCASRQDWTDHLSPFFIHCACFLHQFLAVTPNFCAYYFFSPVTQLWFRYMYLVLSLALSFPLFFKLLSLAFPCAPSAVTFVTLCYYSSPTVHILVLTTLYPLSFPRLTFFTVGRHVLSKLIHFHFHCRSQYISSLGKMLLIGQGRFLRATNTRHILHSLKGLQGFTGNALVHAPLLTLKPTIIANSKKPMKHFSANGCSRSWMKFGS